LTRTDRSPRRVPSKAKVTADQRCNAVAATAIMAIRHLSERSIFLTLKDFSIKCHLEPVCFPVSKAQQK
jgi:hypothetical protein